MKRITTCVSVIALVAFAATGCKKKDDDKKKKAKPTPTNKKPVEPKKVAVADPAKPADPAKQMPPVSVLVDHKIGDFAQWKKAFDAHEPKRKEAGVIGHLVGHEVKDKNMVFVHLIATDLAKTQALLASEDLKKAMKEAGVVGKPTIVVGKNHALSPKGSETGAMHAIKIEHEVEDFAAWKKAYDEHAEMRKKSTIVAGGVMTVEGKPNSVVVFGLAKDDKKLDEFLKSDDLKEAMKKAGVKGKPTISMGKVLEVKLYK